MKRSSAAMTALLSLAVVSTSLLASRAQAAMDNTPLSCGTEPTYYPRGDRWIILPQTTTPVRATPIEYRIQQDGTTDIQSSDAEKEAIARAATRWNEHTCAGGAPPNVALVRGADFPERTAGDQPPTYRNIVYFLEGGNNGAWSGDSQTIALTLNVFMDGNKGVLTSDMAFNGVDFDFRAKGNDNQVRGCTAGQAGCYDVEVVALHEFGHFLGFNHVQCTDAVMYPKADPKGGLTQLSVHEKTGLCNIYPPRDQATAARDFGEQCQNDGQCKTGHICIVASGWTYGYCTKSCTTTDNCPTAYVCAQMPNGGRKFCMPGVHNTGSTVLVNENGLPPDFCAPCSGGDQCSNGICVGDGTAGVCTTACTDTSGCPTGMTCEDTSQGMKVCWPQSSTSCGNSDTRAGLNEVCYQGGATPEQDEAVPCGPGLVCFVFKPRCEGQQGACVAYCNDSDTPCPDPMTCCYGLDNSGHCISQPSLNAHVGGCFDLRAEGESCVTAENSLCESGLGCFNFGDVTLSRCYKDCASAACGYDQTCMSYSMSCDQSSASLCCNNGTGTGNVGCEPSNKVTALDVGVACEENQDCRSGICLDRNGQKACSRYCDATTEYGCPDNIDVNNDGVTDGGFDCIEQGSEGYCWPKRGPASPPEGWGDEEGTSNGGCCSALDRPLSAKDVALMLLTWLPVIAYGVWRRRRALR